MNPSRLHLLLRHLAITAGMLAIAAALVVGAAWSSVRLWP